MATVLVTGAAGLIGRRVSQLLRQDGHVVVGFDRVAPAESGDGAFVVGDLTDADLLESTVAGHAVQRVVHLAALIAHQCEADPVACLETNCLATAHLIDLAQRRGMERVCLASSIAAVGVGDRGVALDEEAMPRPETAYGMSKRWCEMLAAATKQRGFDVVAIRPGLTYGPGRMSGAVGALLTVLRDVGEGRPAVLRFWPGGRQGRAQLMHVDDMAAAFVAATVGPPSPHAVFNAPLAEPCGLDEFLGVIRELVPGAEIEVEVDEWVDEGLPILDGRRLSEAYGFGHQIDLRNGLAQVAAAMAALDQG